MTEIERLCEVLIPPAPDVPAAVGVVARAEPLRVSVRGITFDRAQIQCNAACAPGKEEDGVKSGSRVLCATLDGWQTIILICEVV